MPNERIIAVLTFLKVLRLLQGKKGEARANQNAITSIAGLNFELKSGKEALDAHVPNIGKEIAKHIDEILSVKPSKAKSLLSIGHTGIPDLDSEEPELLQEVNSICDLMRISGISFKKAKDLYEHGVKSIDDLPQSELSHREAVYLKHIDEFAKRIPRKKIEIYSNEFKKALNSFNARHRTHLDYSVTGSYRRERHDSRAVDILLFSCVCLFLVNLFTVCRTTEV